MFLQDTTNKKYYVCKYQGPNTATFAKVELDATTANLIADVQSFTPYLVDGNIISVLISTSIGSRVAKYTWTAAPSVAIIKTSV